MNANGRMTRQASLPERQGAAPKVTPPQSNTEKETLMNIAGKIPTTLALALTLAAPARQGITTKRRETTRKPCASCSPTRSKRSHRNSAARSSTAVEKRSTGSRSESPAGPPGQNWLPRESRPQKTRCKSADEHLKPGRAGHQPAGEEHTQWRPSRVRGPSAAPPRCERHQPRSRPQSRRNAGRHRPSRRQDG